MRKNIIDDSKSDQESIDLNKLTQLPKARHQMMQDDESETHYSEMYTVRDSFIDKTYKNREEFKFGEFREQNDNGNNLAESQKLLRKEYKTD